MAESEARRNISQQQQQQQQQENVPTTTTTTKQPPPPSPEPTARGTISGNVSEDDIVSWIVVDGGAQGSIKIGRHKTSKRAVAVKTLAGARPVQNIEREILQKTSDTECPLFAKYYGPLYTKQQKKMQPDLSTVVMEFVQGGNLNNYRQPKSLVEGRTPLSAEETCFFGAEVLKALSIMHGLGYLHLDLKPANVMLSAKGHIKLVDFGLSRLKTNSRVQKGLGTADFLAPEIQSTLTDDGSTNQDRTPSVAVTTAVDMWAYGVFLYAIRSGSTLLDDFDNNFTKVRGKFTSKYWLFCQDQAAINNMVEVKIASLSDAKTNVRARDLLTVLIKNLLFIDPKLRMTSDNAMRHGFFKEVGHIVDWRIVEKAQLPLPASYAQSLPQYRDEFDTTNFKIV